MKRRIISLFLSVVMVTSMVSWVPITADTTVSDRVISTEENDNQSAGIFFQKSAIQNNDGSVTIEMEAYSTGSIKPVEIITPTDIILVLDMSGSMNDNAYAATDVYTPVDGDVVGNRNRSYGFSSDIRNSLYIKMADGSYQQVSYFGTDDEDYQYYYYGSYYNRTYVYPELNGNLNIDPENNYSVVQFYHRTTQQDDTKKIDILQDAVKTFINETLNMNNGVEEADQHRISIIKYASENFYMRNNAHVIGNNTGAENNSSYNYTQIVTDLDYVNNSTVNNMLMYFDDIDTAVNDELVPGGATAVDYGMELAKYVLDKRDIDEKNSRNEVVVVFTDGQPTHGSVFSSSVAKAAVNTAYDIKQDTIMSNGTIIDDGADIYTISVDTSADSSILGDGANQAMHYISSNFPKADISDRNAYINITEGTDGSITNGYYKTPDKDTSLSMIFSAISSNISQPTIELGSEAQISDIISPYFSINSVNGDYDVEILVSAYDPNDTDGDSSVWEEPIEDSSVQYSITDAASGAQILTVSGYDFDENHVSSLARGDSGDFYGSKLVIRINVLPDYTLIDNAASAGEFSNRLETNVGTAKIMDSSQNTIAEVNSPTVDLHAVEYYVIEEGLTTGSENRQLLYKEYRLPGYVDLQKTEPSDNNTFTYGRWETDDVTVNADGTFIIPDADVVFEVTGLRKSYTVSYQYVQSGLIPNGADALLPEPVTYTWGETVTVAPGVEIPGYDFSGWQTSDEVVENGQFVMPNHNVTLYGTFSEGQAMYRIEYYFMDVEGNYPDTPTQTVNPVSTTGNTAKVDVQTYQHYTYDIDTTRKNNPSSNTVTEQAVSGFVASDSSLVLRIYYSRNQYTVSYSYANGTPSDAPALPTVPYTGTFYYGESVHVAPDATLQDYTFLGWTTTSNGVHISNEQFLMPGNNVEFIGAFDANSGIEYTVYHHLQDLKDPLDSDSYTVATTQVLHGEAGQSVTAPVLTFEGYTYNDTKSADTKSGEVKTGLELHLYYDLTPYTITYEWMSGYDVPDGATLPEDKEKHYIGQSVGVKNIVDIPGYSFHGWLGDYDSSAGAYVTYEPGSKLIMPDQNLLLVGHYLPDDSYYIVEHYLQNADGTWPAAATFTDSVTHHDDDPKRPVKVDDEVTAAYLLFEGYEKYTGSDVDTILSGTVIPTTPAPLTLKLYYGRVEYDVSYRIEGDAHGAVVPETKSYRHGDTVYVEAKPEVAGYIFDGWHPAEASGDIIDGHFTMPDRNIVLKGTFIPRNDTKYVVVHHLQNLNGTGYTQQEAEILTGVTGTPVVGQYKNYNGFVPAQNNNNEKIGGVITGYTVEPLIQNNKLADTDPAFNGLVIHLYYDRNQYTVTYEYRGDIPDTAPQVPEAQTVPYETIVDVAEVPSVAGYRFVGWVTQDAEIENGEFTVLNNVTLIGLWIKLEANLYISSKEVTEVNGEPVNDDSTYHVGDIITWTITVSNTGNIDGEIAATQFEDILYYKDDDGNLRLLNEVVTVNTNMPLTVPAASNGVNGTAVIEVTWEVPESAEGLTIVNTARLDDDEPAESEEIKITEGVLTITKEVDYATTANGVTEGTTVKWNITVSNIGDGEGKFKLVDELSYGDGSTINADITFTKAGVSCDPESTFVIQPGETLEFVASYVVTQEDTGLTLINKIIADDPDNDEDDPSDESDPVDVAPYTVTYQFDGSIPEGAVLPVDKNEYTNNAEVTVEGVEDVPGYIFSGWEDMDENNKVVIVNGKFHIHKNVTLVGSWTRESNDLYITEKTVAEINGNPVLDKDNIVVKHGDEIVWTVSAVNTGDETVSIDETNIIDTLYGDGEILADADITIDIRKDSLNPGEEAVIAEISWMVADVEVGTIVVNHVQIDDDPEDDIDPDDGDESEEILVGASDLSVQKTILRINGNEYTGVLEDDVVPGDTIEWKITVINNGDALGRFVLVDELMDEEGEQLPADITITLDGKNCVADEKFTVDADSTLEFIAAYVVDDADAGHSLINRITVKDSVDNPDEPDDPTDESDPVDIAPYKVTYVYVNAPRGIEPPADNTEYKLGEYAEVLDHDYVDGYSFDGWYLETTNGEQYRCGEEIEITGHITLIGEYTVEEPDGPYTVTYIVNDKIYKVYEEEAGNYHDIITGPKLNNPFYWFAGWSAPVNERTGDIIPVRNDRFVMPEDNVVIYGEYESPLLPNPDLWPDKEPEQGKLIIEKTLNAPESYNGPTTFSFLIYHDSKNDKEYVETVYVEAGEQISVNLEPGNYFVYEEEEVVDGYSYTVLCSEDDYRVTVKPNAAAVISFENIYTAAQLETEDHFAYIIGYPDGLVKPEANITRAEVATIFFRMLTDESRAAYWSTNNSFMDVNEKDWYNNAVSTLANAGILNGYADGTFRPNEYITRAELVKIAASFYGTQAGKGSAFSDTSEHWANVFINAAYELGFIDGYGDGTFKPDQLMTRAETMKVINRALGRAPHKDHLHDYMITWEDNMDTSKWYYAEVQEATNSHTYEWEVEGHENWLDILPVRDWAALEKRWSYAFSR